MRWLIAGLALGLAFVFWFAIPRQTEVEGAAKPALTEPEAMRNSDVRQSIGEIMR